MTTYRVSLAVERLAVCALALSLIAIIASF